MAVRGARESTALLLLHTLSREHEGRTERDTEGVGWDMSQSLKLFLVSGSLFSETSARNYNLDLRFLVKLKKQISMIVANLS